MPALGGDFSGGLLRRIYAPANPAGLWLALVIAAGLLLLHQGLQVALSAIVVKLLFASSMGNTRDLVKSSLVVIFPASLLIAGVALLLAKVKGGNMRDVLNLRWPRISPLGWIVLVIGFMIVMYLAIAVIVVTFGIDLAQYTPGPDGKSPNSGSAGLVKEAMYDIVNEPFLFLLVFPSVAFGAPIAEELIFRGQLFSALSLTRLGVPGTTIVTSAMWALLHMSEPWLSIGLIFVMGLVFGWMMYRFGSIWVTMTCHGAWNSFYAIALFASVGAQT
jgi:membrane protease YdiL (CAAX protease family)